jgi:hypothetical protein
MHPKKQQIEQELSRVDTSFLAAAASYDLEFERRAGPDVGRSLRARSGLERGVFLELKTHWMQSDVRALSVTLSHCAWLRLTSAGHPLYFFTESLYDGSLDELIPRLKSLLDIAAARLSQIDGEFVKRCGRYLELPGT